MTLGDYVRLYREEHDLTMDAFSQMCGLSKGYISMLEKNRNPKTKQAIAPTLGTYKAIAEVIGVDLNDLIRAVDGNQLVALTDTLLEINSDEVSRPNMRVKASESSDTTSIRFMGEVAAGFDAVANEEYEYLRVPTEWLGGKPASAFFALRVRGSSMYPMFCEDDEILCLSTPDMGRSGRIGVIAYGEDEATLKKIVYERGKGWVDLVPINPEYQTRRIDGADLEKCRVLGRVLRVIRTMDEI